MLTTQHTLTHIVMFCFVVVFFLCLHVLEVVNETDVVLQKGLKAAPGLPLGLLQLAHLFQKLLVLPNDVALHLML